MQSFAQISEAFEAYLQQNPLPAQPAGLYSHCTRLLANGGKRIRPALCLMANELMGSINDDAWHAAMALELFHNFTLVHDDIMDAAPLRRGQPTVHQQHGLTAGILCGDVLSMLAFRQLANIKNHLAPVLQLFTDTAIQVCEGQQLDMEFETRKAVTTLEYTEMVSLKTSVLLAASLHIGATLGGATTGNAAKLYDFGRNMGIAFQLQDDYLDAFGDPQKTGKQAGGDILANKKTLVSIAALENADGPLAEELAFHTARNEPGKVARMLDIYRLLGADEQCRYAAHQYSEKAFHCLEDVAVVSSRKAPLMELAAFLLHREF